MGHPALCLGKRGLELQRCGCGDFVEGEVLGGTAGALFPGEEQAAVALSEASGGVDAKTGEGIVDPGGRAFELRVVADGGLVDDEVAAGGRRGGISGESVPGEERRGTTASRSRCS